MGANLTRVLGLLLLLAGCAAEPMIPSPLAPKREAPVAAEPAPAPAGLANSPGGNGDTPQVPAIPKPKSEGPVLQPPPTDGMDEKADLLLNFDQLPLPSFARIVFGEILKKNVQIDQKVRDRRDLVTLRSGSPQTRAQVEKAAVMLLKSFGVAAIDVGGVVRVIPDSGNLGYLPEIFRGGALPDTPLPMRPQFHLVELQAVRNPDVTGWLRTMFGERIKVQEDATRNAVLLSGTPDNLAAALEAIRVLDQPVMHGRQSLRLTPSFWSVEDFAKRLHEVLSAEGYAVQPLNQGGAAGTRYPVILLPVSAINSVLVFATRPEILNHIQDWSRTLDQPGGKGVGRDFFTYPVQHQDASVLAPTLDQLLGGNRSAGAAPADPKAAAPKSATPLQRVVVDKASNTLIFQGNPEDYSQIKSLLATLDRPSREALIEVTVAEVTLTDKFQFGVEWAIRDAMRNGSLATASTVGGLSVGNSGFTYRIVDSGNQLKLLVNGLASNNQATILSSPRVMARNGESATIQVGQEVPIITSQQSTLNATTAVQTGVMQSIQYRNTGVILRVKPVIHSGDNVDLDVAQEVSAAQETTTGVNNSPTFGTRKVETKLTLKNGSTVMLGGLISNSVSDGNAGIPWLKDIPVLGNLFKSQTNNKNRTELIVLITPYVVNDDYDAQAVTKAFRNMLGSWARDVTVSPAMKQATVLPGAEAPGAAPAAQGAEREAQSATLP